MGEPRHDLYFCALAPLAIGATVPHRLFGRPCRAHLLGQPVLTCPPPRAHKWLNSLVRHGSSRRVLFLLQCSINRLLSLHQWEDPAWNHRCRHASGMSAGSC